MSKKYATITHFFFFFTYDILSIGSAEKRCLQAGRVCDIVEFPQSRMATATHQDCLHVPKTSGTPRGFDQSTMLISYQGLALLTLSWDKIWDSHSLVKPRCVINQVTKGFICGLLTLVLPKYLCVTNLRKSTCANMFTIWVLPTFIRQYNSEYINFAYFRKISKKKKNSRPRK